MTRRPRQPATTDLTVFELRTSIDTGIHNLLLATHASTRPGKLLSDERCFEAVHVGAIAVMTVLDRSRVTVECHSFHGEKWPTVFYIE